ncbi:normocyte-binding protein [Lysinibacillus irui]|uniref:Normocyte-binding protein n=1 Tax=Lysinibacillus irui TaxID=2998077 RepID=A0ABU5NKI4_9BACI|nr:MULTISPECIES: normocyte-binding protein [Lysinibacillus]MEA0554840.1 normocyte-binding protein [Lysinibacillus irui]MEA0976555.1 normocyte-binding protein [Lysinibacillus irui]MEA1042709.1 normocyte-binding protein [Lysinibacillus irui]
MIKELMYERLRKIEDLEQRQLLKDIVSGVFVNLIDYQDEMNRKLEERVFNEIEDVENRFDIYVTLSSKEDVDPIHQCLFPMRPADLETKVIDTANLLQSLKNKEQAVLCTLFLECDSIQIHQLLVEERCFNGTLVTTEGQVEIKVSLSRNSDYLQEIDKLYPIFQINGLPWKTINHPYAYKFLDVNLVDCPPLNEDTEIIEIMVDLEEYESKKRLDMVPLWNIERHEVKNVGFPIPAIDKINYEHVLSIRKTGNEHGYLVEADEENVRYVKRSDNELTIVSPQDKSGVWQLIKIAKMEDEKIGKLHYELVSNRRIEHFMHKFASKYTANVKTKGEITRMINSFEAAVSVELVDVDIVDSFSRAGITHSANPFLTEMIGENSHKKTMLLKFKAKAKKDFIANDILSFLVSEVQRHFFEYKCVGVWL